VPVAEPPSTNGCRRSLGDTINVCCRCAGLHYDPALADPLQVDAGGTRPRPSPDIHRPRQHRSASPSNSGRITPQPSASDAAARIKRFVETAEREHGITGDVAQFDVPSTTGTVHCESVAVAQWIADVERPPSPACRCQHCT
jgi:hypothetical protein